ncbi:MAG TPA: MFS transporter [Microbacterium sp.]|nr:MFS transporter [Microbacterium sp.]
MTQLSTTQRNLALFALALGGFAIGITEFATMGLLPGMAQELLTGYQENPQQVIAQAGTLITVYALGVVAGAPAVAVFGARMSETKLTYWLIVLLFVGTLASALMPTFGSVLLFRFIAGLPHGAYFGVVSLLAGRLMGPGSEGRGIALAMSGLTVANVIGVPLSTLLGQQLGWRWVYGLVALLFAVTFVFVLLFLPKYPGNPERSPLRELRAFRNPRVWIMVGVSSIGFGGFFAVYSYIAEVTTRQVGFSASVVPWMLAAMGLGMVIGNLIGGYLTDRKPSTAAVWGLALSLVAILLYTQFADTKVGLFVFAFLVSGTSALLMPSLQSRLIRVSNEAKLLGAALNHAAFNIANSLGAWLGGLVIAGGFGYLAPGWVGAVLTAIGLVLILISVAFERRDRRRGIDTGGIVLPLRHAGAAEHP